eukprot:1581009-Rhodomonas_salina.1
MRDADVTDAATGGHAARRPHLERGPPPGLSLSLLPLLPCALLLLAPTAAVLLQYKQGVSAAVQTRRQLLQYKQG